MKEFFHIVAFVFLALLIIDAALYRYIKKKKNGSAKWLNKKINEYFVSYLLIVLIFSVWLFFFEDRSLYLECRKDTMICNYFRSTYFNEELRLAKTYDISRIGYARAKKNMRFGRHARHYYTVELVEINKNYGLNLAPEYSDINAAGKEAQRFNSFLSGRKNSYIFRKEPSVDSFGPIIGFVAGLFAFFLAAGFLWNLVCAIFKLHKEEKRRPRKKETPPSDDIIRRNR